MVVKSKGNPLISGKPGLVKYNNLARMYPYPLPGVFVIQHRAYPKDVFAKQIHKRKRTAVYQIL